VSTLQATIHRFRERAIVKDYISITKPGITTANLMATFAGLWVGSHGYPGLLTMIATLLGTALVVASGASMNNYVDRDIDYRMKRTRQRAVASGKVTPGAAFVLGMSLGILGIVILALGAGIMAAGCAFIGLVMYAYIYTVWLKRTTTWSTVIGGVAGAMPPVVGYAAGSGGMLGLDAVILFLLFFFWQPPHFFPLAMKRVEEYRAAGIPMLPVVKGFALTKKQIIFYTILMVVTSFLLYFRNIEGILYLTAALVLGVLYVYHALEGLRSKDDLAWAGKVFGYSLLYLTVMSAALVVGVK
jgi:heme o synthase